MQVLALDIVSIAAVCALHSFASIGVGAHAGFISLDVSGHVIVSAFQEDTEQLGSSDNPVPLSTEKNRASPAAGVPEVVSCEQPNSFGSTAASLSVKGTWSHAALHETPVMKCPRKPTRDNKSTHIIFQQVAHFKALLIILLASAMLHNLIIIFRCCFMTIQRRSCG
jgi:hypothetical protein